MTELPDKIKPPLLIDGYYEIDRTEHEVLDDLVSGFNQLIDYLAEQVEITVIKSGDSIIVTNGKTGGWVKLKNNAYVSEEYIKTLDRAGRRKLIGK